MYISELILEFYVNVYRKRNKTLGLQSSEIKSQQL